MISTIKRQRRQKLTQKEELGQPTPVESPGTSQVVRLEVARNSTTTLFLVPQWQPSHSTSPSSLQLSTTAWAVWRLTLTPQCLDQTTRPSQVSTLQVRLQEVSMAIIVL